MPTASGLYFLVWTLDGRNGDISGVLRALESGVVSMQEVKIRTGRTIPARYMPLQHKGLAGARRAYTLRNIALQDRYAVTIERG